MSLYDRLSPPESDYSDEEWDRAREQLIDERVDLGWSRADAEARVDDLMVEEQCVQNREDRDASWACDVNKRRREES